MPRYFETTAVAALLLCFLWAPAINEAAESPSRKSPSQGISKSPKKSVVVAEVNGRRITLSEIRAYLQGLPPEVSLQALKDPKRFLEDFVQTELLYQEALRRKVDILPEVQARISVARRRILIEELVHRVADRPGRISDEEVARFFKENRRKFQREETVRLSHIILASEKDATEALAELRRGTPFEEVSRRRSIFESARKSGGALGVIRRGELDLNLEKAAFSLPIGAISQPIKTPVGWQIIRVIERTPGSEAQIEEVRDDIRKMISEFRSQQRYDLLLERLRRENKITLHPERLQ